MVNFEAYRKTRSPARKKLRQLSINTALFRSMDDE